MNVGKITPILRIFDESKAKEFYLDFLGFKVDWEHRFADDLPLYMGISKDDCVIHLSEHHGDCSPGSAIRITTNDVNAYQQELIARQYRYARPSLQDQPWGTREMSISDPFGNRLIFTTEISTSRQGEKLMGSYSIAAYRPLAGKEAELLEEVKNHLRTLQELGLATARPSQIMRATDGTIIEVFEWKSEEAIQQAHTNPGVLAMWERFGKVCEYTPLTNVAESHDLFAQFEPIDF